MKNFKKRALSMFLAFMLCASLIPVSAFAADEEGSAAVVTGEGTVESPKKETATTTTETRDEGTGQTTITTETNSEWTGETTEGGSDIAPDETTTTVTGSENKTESSTTDSQDRPIKETGEVTGSETTTTTTNTSEMTDKDVEQPEDIVEPDKKEDGTINVEQDVSEGNNSEFSDYDTDNLPEQDIAGSKEIDVADPDDWNESNVTVTLTPGGGKTTVTVTVNTEKLMDQLKEQNQSKLIPPEGAKVTEDDTGNVTSYEVTGKNDAGKEYTETVTLVPVMDGDKVIGYKTTTVTTTKDDRIASETGPETVTNETETGTPQKGEASAPVEEIKLPDRPEVKAPVTDDNGNTTEVTVSNLYKVDDEGNQVKDENGDPIVVGYMSTTTVKDKDGNIISKDSESIWGTITTTVITPVTTTNKLEQTVTTTYTQLVTRATDGEGWYYVVDNEVNGVQCGVWAEMGKIVNKNGESQITNLNPTIKEPDTGKTDTVTDLFHRADAVPYKVTANSLNIRFDASTSGDIVGSLKKDSIVFVSETKVVGSTTWGKIGSNQWISLSYAGTDEVSKIAAQDQFIYLGEYGLESAIRVNGKDSNVTQGGTWQPHQFIIYDDQGNKHYVYCADFEVSPKAGTNYGMTPIENATGYWSSDSGTNSNIAKHVQAIALNGYWGTESGAGSLNAMKELLKEAIRDGKVTSITDADVEKLTPGIALTATQAAIWSFATSGDTINVNDPFGAYCKDGVIQYGSNSYFTAEDEKVAKALYDYLRELTVSTTKVIGIADIASASITVKSLEKDTDGNAIITEAGNNKYKTDVSFVLDITPSTINDDLIVKVVNPETGDIIATRRLAGDDSITQYGMITPDTNGNYTITDLVLENGVKINLNLSGTQLLEKSAYLITAQGPNGADAKLSQTFVSAKEETKKIDLTVDLTFGVDIPQATLVKTDFTSTGTRTDTIKDYYNQVVTQKHIENLIDKTMVNVSQKDWYQVWESEYTYPEPTPEPEPTPDPGPGPRPSRDPNPTPTPIPDEDVPLSSIPEPEVPLSGAPEEPTMDIPDEDVPLADMPDVPLPEPDVPLAQMPPEETTIPDPDVPLAGVPSTGEERSLWSGVALVCGAGLAMLVIGKRREDA